MRAALIGAAAAGAWSVPALAPIAPSLCPPLGIERRLDGTPAGVALTFDDGPHRLGTPAILDVLGDANARATFFLVGEQVERAPALAAEIVAAGHGVALHGHRHRNLLLVPPRALARDLACAVDVIAGATGRVPDVYRPPYGIFSPPALALARRHGWRALLWSRWGRDWAAGATPASITARVTEGVRAGDVLLLHDADHYSAAGSWRHTAAALPAILDEIAVRGLRTVAL